MSKRTTLYEKHQKQCFCRIEESSSPFTAYLFLIILKLARYISPYRAYPLVRMPYSLLLPFTTALSNEPKQSGPANASFAKLWLQNQHSIGGFVCLHVPDHHLADDILQEVAELAAEKFEQYDHDRPFIAWLIGIARNRIAQAYRERGRRPIVYSSEVLDSIANAYTTMQPTEDDRLDGLHNCMAKLSDRHRRVIELRYARQMSSQQIADQVSCSPRAVTSMLQRIRTALRKCVSQYVEDQR